MTLGAFSWKVGGVVTLRWHYVTGHREQVDMDSIATGVPGLDEILRSGLPRGHSYLFQGKPGAGKSTLAVQFLLEGVRRGEKSLYVTLLHAKKSFEEAALSQVSLFRF